MTLRPFFRAAARLEYDEAAGWYEAQRSGLGVEFVAEIERALQQACKTPQRFPRMLSDVQCVWVRRFPYSIFFAPEATGLSCSPCSTRAGIR